METPTQTPVKEARNKAPFLVACIVVLLLGCIAGAYLWNSQVKELKANRDADAMKIEELNKKVKELETPEEVSGPGKDQSETFVKKFYTSYIDAVDKAFQDGNFANLTAVVRDNSTEAQLATYTSAGGADSILCAQDTPASFTIKSSEISEDYTKVVVSTKYSQSTGKDISVQVVKDGDALKINKVSCPSL